MQQQSQQSSQTASVPTSSFFLETDPIAAAKLLILKDLRRAITDVNLNAERASQRTFGLNGIGFNTSDDNKRSVAPSSNSQMTPLSVTNPQSVLNPMSVNAPNSVKSTSDDKMSTDGNLENSGSANVNNNNTTCNALENYSNSYNNLLNICDDIEKNLQVIVEVYRRMHNFERTCSIRTPADIGSSSFPQLQQNYIDLMTNDKRSLSNGIERVSQLYRRFRSERRAPPLIISSDNFDLSKVKQSHSLLQEQHFQNEIFAHLPSSTDCKIFNDV